MKPDIGRQDAHVTLSVLCAVLLVLFVVLSSTKGAISTSGNVQPAYPGSSPDPWNTGDELSVGDAANGSVSITGGSDVASTGGTAGFNPAVMGTVTVSGTGSTWANSQNLVLGVFGIGKLEVLAGGQVTNQSAFVGHLSGIGQVLVGGTGSHWSSTQSLFVGNSGTGSLTIQQQGRVQSDSAVIAVANSSNGSVVVDGQQSTWEVSNSLSVGDATNGGAASLTLTGAGSRVYVGAGAATYGTTLPIDQTAVVVSKLGTAAKLSVFEGNSIQNAGNAYLGAASGEAGEVVVNGAATSWINNGGVFIGVNGTGALSLVDGGTVSGSSITIGAGGVVSGVGTFVGAVSNAGLVRPGQSVGALSVTGSYAQAATGRLGVELVGTSAGAFDTINVSGQAALSGTLEVDLGLVSGNPFEPQVGDSFALLTAAGGLTGTFASAQLPTLASGKMWHIRYSANAATLAVKLAGDYNDNGIVDAADYSVWRDKLGSTLDPRADGDTNGIVNLLDYNIWKANFGASAGAGAVSAAAIAPESPTAVLGLVCLVGCVLFGPIRRRLDTSSADAKLEQQCARTFERICIAAAHRVVVCRGHDFGRRRVNGVSDSTYDDFGKTTAVRSAGIRSAPTGNPTAVMPNSLDGRSKSVENA